MRRLMQAWADTGATAALVFGLDDDDETFTEEVGQSLIDLADELDVNVTAHKAKRTDMVGTLNVLADLYSHATYKYVGFMGDDHCPRTPKWDARMNAVLEAMGTGIAYGNDLMQRETLPTAVFMTADIVQTLGYMAPPMLKHLYVDNAWRDWGQGIKRYQYLDDVIIEHMHPQADKAEWDEGHIRVNGPEMWDHDVEAYRVYCADHELGDLTKLRALI